MKTFKASKTAVIKNSHTAEEMREIEREFVRKDSVKYTLKELLETESLRKAKA